MEDGRGLGAGADSSSSFRLASSCESYGDRTRFTVDLRPGETTIVSWKKLIKDVSKSDASASSAPEPPPNAALALEGRPDSNEVKDVAAPSRFNAVIEKIERLYMGKDSSDGEELDDVPDEDEYDTEDSFIDDRELDEYFEVDNAKTKHDGFFVNKGKLESMEPSSSPNQQPIKKKRKEMEKGKKTIEENGLGHGTNDHMKMVRKGPGKSAPEMENNSFPTSVSCSGTKPQKIGADDSGHVRYTENNGSVHVRYTENNGSGHLKPQLEEANNDVQSGTSSQHRENNGNRELIDLNVAACKHPMKTSLIRKREGSGFVLDKAIRELEKMVAESRPPATDLQDADATSQAVKKRLSQEIKQKLAKVAKVAQASHGKVSKELLSRLMSILGHLINARTLKRNLNIMISSSLSVNQEKDEKFQRIKREIVEMIKTCAPPLISKAAEQQNGSADEFQGSGLEDKGVKKVIHTIDPALEDKICDLYDIFVDGLDEDVAPQARKLYAELAALWPKGVMDNHGIKRAICHSKERRRALHDRNKEIIKRKKLVAAKMEETIQAEPTPAVQPQHAQERKLPDFGGNVTNSSNKFATSASTSTPTSTNLASMTLALPAPSACPQNFKRPKHEKINGSSSSSYVEIRAADGTLVKKKIKRKRETDSHNVHPRPEKLSIHNEDRQKSHKQQQSEGPLVTGVAQNPSFQSTALPSFQQLT